MVSFPIIPEKTKNKLIFCTLSATLLLILWALSFRVAGGSSGKPLLTISFYDVGQGDAILIAKGETQILVDGGPNDEILSYLGQDLPPWDRKIELMVLTHPHADHLTGLLSVLERYQVERILFYPVVYETKGYHKFLKEIEDEGAVILKGENGVEMEVSEMSLRVLWPKKGFSDTDINNTSVVLALKFKEFDVLLLGDAERKAQISFLSITPDIEVLKVAHQGSWNGVYEPLLRQASPEVAVISVGKNQYGHPHHNTLRLLEQLGATVLRTDLSGTIKLMSDGNKFWYDTAR